MAVVSNEERNLNYDNFVGRLDIELQRAKRYGRVVSVCIISIDGAHEDKGKYPKSFLRDFTQMILDQARTVDISTTISSEEFALILPETAFANALQAVERIRATIAEHAFVDEDKERRITVSIGLAAYPEHSSDTAELARRALQAADMAKQKGGNKVCTASDL
ncbi:MAG TPA: GGDEF domain-containing protein [Candidatus Obscuribacterales bacterium]